MVSTYQQHNTFDRFDPYGRTLAEQFFRFWVHQHVVVVHEPGHVLGGEEAVVPGDARHAAVPEVGDVTIMI